MAKIVVEVCAGTKCTLMGAMDIISSVESLKDLHGTLKPECEIDVRPVRCNHACDKEGQAPVVYVNGEIMIRTDTESVMEKVFNIARELGCL
ncbi:MAG: NAD(P)H-dependent oxidoreductase subunit E [Saccharofermentanales bacterium]|jgi:NADH:ubiquinone oxidoreductase subunit E